MNQTEREGMGTTQLTDDDVKDITTARLTILRHLEGFDDTDPATGGTDAL